jgi:hypothetical protein
MEKIKVRLFCSTHDLQSKVSDIIKVDADTTDEDLEGMAEDFFWNSKEPCWWFEKIEE